jgi:hypothetical protein
MKPLKLPIFYNTDETSALDKMGVDFPLEDCQIRTVIFYHIAAISPYLDGKKEYTYIHSNGDKFICPKPLKEVEALIYVAMKA